jgi:hypothetical protein
MDGITHPGDGGGAAPRPLSRALQQSQCNGGHPSVDAPSVTSSSVVGYAVTVPITPLGAKALFLGIDVGLLFPRIDHGVDLLFDTRNCCTICRHR